MSNFSIDMLVQYGSSSDPELVSVAEKVAREWESDSFESYVASLAAFLMGNQNDVMQRYFAGILLKNCLQSDDYDIKRVKDARWLGMSQSSKDSLKSDMFALFSHPARKIKQIAARVLSEIGVIEVPKGLWPDFFKNFFDIISNPEHDIELKWSAITSLKFITEDLNPPELSPYIQDILNTVIPITNGEFDFEIYLVAVQILESSLKLSADYFKNDQTRDVMMNTILNAFSHSQYKVRKYGYMMMIQVLSLHYDKLTEYITTFATASCQHIQDDNDEETGRYGVSFWLTLAEIERDFNIDGRDYDCQYYILAFAESIVPVLLEAITKQEVDQDQDDYTRSRLSAICLNMIGQTIESELVPIVLPFIEQNIHSENWRLKDTAILALSAIVEVPTSYIFKILSHTVPILINIINDSSTVNSVRSTSTWVLGRICMQHSETSKPFLEDIIRTVLNCMTSMDTNSASNACWTIHNIAHSYASDPNSTYYQYYIQIVQALLEASNRNDSHVDKLKDSAYQALNVAILYSPDSAVEDLMQLMSTFLGSLEELAVSAPSATNIEASMLLWGSVQIFIMRLRTLLSPMYDRLLMCLFAHLDSSFGAKIAEEVFLTLGSYINTAESECFKYVPKIFEYIVLGLMHCYEDGEAISSIVGTISDICTTFGSAVIPFADNVVKSLFQILVNEQLPFFVRPNLLTTIGDMAFAMGDNFTTYVNTTMECLSSANVIILEVNYIDPDDEEFIIYYNELRQSVLELYTGLLQGCASAGDLIITKIHDIMNIFKNIAEDIYRNEGVVNCAIGLAGDLANAYPQTIPILTQTSHIFELIEDTVQYTTDNRSLETALWTRQMLSQQ